MYERRDLVSRIELLVNGVGLHMLCEVNKVAGN